MLYMFAMGFKCFSGVFARVSDAFFKCFICLLLYVPNVASRSFNNRSDVAHVAMIIHVCLKCMFQMFHMFQTYVASVSSRCCKSRSGYCIYIHVKSLRFKCFRCFIRMLQVFHLDVVYVLQLLHMCFSSFFWCFVSVSDVCCKCFSCFGRILQVFFFWIWQSRSGVAHGAMRVRSGGDASGLAARPRVGAQNAGCQARAGAKETGV